MQLSTASDQFLGLSNSVLWMEEKCFRGKRNGEVQSNISPKTEEKYCSHRKIKQEALRFRMCRYDEWSSWRCESVPSICKLLPYRPFSGYLYPIAMMSFTQAKYGIGQSKLPEIFAPSNCLQIFVIKFYKILIKGI